MPDLAACFSAAFRLHQQGDLTAAEAGYRAILAAAPGHAATHHLLGLIEQQLGRHDAARRAIGQAIALDPSEPNYHNNLGTVYRSLERLEDAVACHRRALALKPGFAEALNNLALALAQQGHSTAAQRALGEALRLKPDYACARFNLGNLLAARGEHALAAVQLRAALAQAPGFADAWHNLGAALIELGELDEAAECCRRVLALQPQDVAALCNYAQVLARRDALAAAEECLDRALALDPSRIEAHVNRGNVLLEQGRPQAAHESYARALAIDPDHAGARRNDGLALLTLGDLENGFTAWRWRAAAGLRVAAREWRGEPLAGASILIHAEQGLGDAIQFARYLPGVAARGGHVTLEAPAELHRLFTGIAGVERLIASGAAAPAAAWHCPLLSLPLAFGTTLATVPPAPYLAADPAAAAQWRRRLAGEGLTIGLAWAGNPEHKRDRQRSLPLALLAPLLATPQARFFALQKGAALAEADALGDTARLDILAPQLGDFADTAAAIMALDLVISVDTSVAHLAGALGKPVWLLLPHAADWRWLESRADSPWYPTARLFRQDASRRWEPAIAAAAEALRALAARSQTRKSRITKRAA